MNPTTPLFDRGRTLTLTLLAVMLVAIALPVAVAQALTVQTDKDIYALGDVMVVSGTTAPSASVSLQVFNPEGTQCAIDQTTADSDGNYQMSVTFPSEPTDLYPLGTYTVKVYSAGNTAEKTVELASEAPLPTPPPTGQIAISIDVGAFYFPGETATFHILTTVNGIPATLKGVTWNLYLPDGTKVPLTPATVDVGLYKVEYELPADALEGSYTLMVYAVQGDYKASAIKSFQVSTTLSDLNAKLEALDEAVTAIDKDLESVKDSVSGVKSSVDDVKSSLKDLESSVGDVKSALDDLKSSLDDVKSSVDAIKSSVEGVPDAISGVTMPIYIAVILSLIAAIAAIASVIQISRKIAG